MKETGIFLNLDDLDKARTITAGVSYAIRNIVEKIILESRVYMVYNTVINTILFHSLNYNVFNTKDKTVKLY